MPTAYALIPASYVYLCRDDTVLLQRRIGTGYMDGHWVAGAAGHVEPGETARQAAVRETVEELGIHLAPDDLTLLTVMQRTDGSADPREQRVDWFWAATRWRGSPTIREPQKAAELAFWPLGGLPEPIPAYERFVLDGLRTGHLPPDSAVGFSAQPADSAVGFSAQPADSAVGFSV